MKQTLFLFLLIFTACKTSQSTAGLARWQAHAANTTIIRDDFGVPHIYGKTDAGAVFGLLYAQCEDDFNRVELNYIRAIGRLTDNKGRGANFKNTVVIMTSNLGSDLIREQFVQITKSNRDEIVENTKNRLFNLLKNTVRPEFLYRIDETIMFQPLSARDVRAIVDLQLHPVVELLKKQDIELIVTPQAAGYIAGEGFNPEFGARPVKRVIQKKVLNELSRQMLQGKVQPKTKVMLDVFDGKVVFREPRVEEVLEEV